MVLATVSPDLLIQGRDIEASDVLTSGVNQTSPAKVFCLCATILPLTLTFFYLNGMHVGFSPSSLGTSSS